MHKKKAGKLQTGITFPKQYWLAVNGKPKMLEKGLGCIVIIVSFRQYANFDNIE